MTLQKLPTAPCPSCRSLVVFGERTCRGCGQRFDYGQHGTQVPPIPTLEQVAFALGVQLPTQPTRPPQAAQVPSPSALLDDLDLFADDHIANLPTTPKKSVSMTQQNTWLETTQLPMTEIAQHIDQVERLAGLIDSTLFAQFVPEHIEIYPLAALEPSPSQMLWEIPLDTGNAAKTEKNTGKQKNTKKHEKSVSCLSCGTRFTYETTTHQQTKKSQIEKIANSPQERRRKREDDEEYTRCPACGTRVSLSD